VLVLRQRGVEELTDVPDAVDPGLTFAGVGGAQLVRFA
jgi:hypothetical protein